MSILFQTTWLTLIGLSFLFVGGFVLWVYGTHNAPALAPANDVEQAARKIPRGNLVQWFLLYGVIAIFFGGGCLLTAAVMLL